MIFKTNKNGITIGGKTVDEISEDFDKLSNYISEKASKISSDLSAIQDKINSKNTPSTWSYDELPDSNISNLDKENYSIADKIREQNEYNELLKNENSSIETAIELSKRRAKNYDETLPKITEINNEYEKQHQLELSNMSVDEAKAVVDQYINTIAKILEEDPVDVKVRLGFDDYNDDDIAPLKTKVQGFLKDEFDDKVGELSLDDLQIASKLEIPDGTLLSWDELKQKIEEAKNATSEDSFEIPDAETLKQQISDLNSAIDSIQSAYDTLNSAVEEYNTNGGTLSIDTIQSLLSLSDEYLACLQVENGQLSLNADAMAQLAQAKLDDAQATAVTQAMTELDTIAKGENSSATSNVNAKAIAIVETHESKIVKTCSISHLPSDY